MAQPKIVYRDTAVGAKEVSSPSMIDIQPFCDVDDLKLDGVTVPKVATLEQDYWLLDGTFSLFPDDPSGEKWGVWSGSMSGPDGTFETPPVLTIELSALFSSVGIGFEFNSYGPDWCNDLNIKWYRHGELLDDADFSPNDWQFPCIREVKNYNKVVVTFRSMSSPYRYLKIRSIQFGITRIFGSKEITQADIYLTAASDELEISTMNLSLRNMSDIPYMFQRKQPLEAYHGDRLLAVFYISSSKKFGGNSFDISSNNLIGLLDESPHRGGIYDGILVPDLLADIMGPYPFDLDPSYADVRMYGWLPIATRRAHLYQVTFVLGAIADTSGRSSVHIRPEPTTVTSVFDEDRVFLGGSIETASLVTAVEVTEHKYAAGTQTQELFSDALNGVKEVPFSAPMHNLTITGGTIVESGANYAIISGTGGTVVLMGSEYIHTTRIVTIANPLVGANDIVNVIPVTDATLISPMNSAEVSQRIYDRCQRRDTLNVPVLLGEEQPGDMVESATEADGRKKGNIKSLEITLGRKLVANTKILCE